MRDDESGILVSASFSIAMSFSAYLWGIRLFTLLSFLAWWGIIVLVDPTQSGMTGVILFFTSLFAFVLGVMTLLLTMLYRRVLGVVSATHHLGGAFRQAFLLSMCFVGLVFFQKEQMLTWWDALLLLAATLLIEFSLRKIFSQEEHS